MLTRVVRDAPFWVVHGHRFYQSVPCPKCRRLIPNVCTNCGAEGIVYFKGPEATCLRIRWGRVFRNRFGVVYDRPWYFVCGTCDHNETLGPSCTSCRCQVYLHIFVVEPDIPWALVGCAAAAALVGLLWH